MIYTYLIMVVSLIAQVANIYKKRWCFYIWLCTNLIWMVHNWSIKEYAQAISFAIYFAFTLWGIIQWGKDDGREKACQS